jgi:hypothetical protein
MKRLAPILVMLFFLCTAGRVNANPMPAATLTSPGETFSGSLYTLGFEFSVNQSLSVTALGVYDDGQDGLANSAQVGIWDISGNLLASVTVPSGTAGTLVGDFRYADISPLTLSPGQDYVVGAYINDTATSFNTLQGGSGFYDPAVNGIEDRFSNFNSMFSFPDSTNDHPGGAWLGGNFLFASPVPEPSSVTLLALGGFGMLGYFWRRRQAVAA